MDRSGEHVGAHPGAGHAVHAADHGKQKVPQSLRVLLRAHLASRLGLPPASASFGTEEQGREQLITALRGRRVLIVADDVREAGQLEAITGLAPKCTVLFTTRQDKLAHEVKAKQVVVRATPQKGPATSDTYALAGFPKALALIDKACGVKR